MPRTVKEKQAGERKLEETKKIHEIGYGETFRFSDVTYHEAVSGKDDACIYMKIKAQPEKTGRVTIVSSDGMIVKEVDDFHIVVPHSSTWVVGPAKMV